jgi:hypothetical protein
MTPPATASLTSLAQTALRCLLGALVGALAAPGVSSPAQAVNAIAQPGFEFSNGSWAASNANPSFCPPSLRGNTGPCYGSMGGYGFLSQALVTPIAGSQITRLALHATMWSGGTDPPCCATTGTLRVTLEYTTGPPTSGEATVADLDHWMPLDFTTAVDPGRTISSIRLEQTGAGYLGVDDVELLVPRSELIFATDSMANVIRVYDEDGNEFPSISNAALHFPATILEGFTGGQHFVTDLHVDPGGGQPLLQRLVKMDLAGNILAAIDSGVDPVSWRPPHLGRRGSRCRRVTRPTRRSSGDGWWSWCAPGGTRRTWRGSSSRRPRRSGTGCDRPSGMRASVRTV